MTMQAIKLERIEIQRYFQSCLSEFDLANAMADGNEQGNDFVNLRAISNISEMRDEDMFYYVHYGYFELFKRSKDPHQLPRREAEVKSGNFFTRIDLRMQSQQPQYLKIVVRGSYSICAIPLNKQFNYEWFRQQRMKCMAISKVFNAGSGDAEVERKKPRFKELVRQFVNELYCRNECIVEEGETHTKLIIVIKGMIKYCKKGKTEAVEVFSLQSGGVIGVEAFVESSKPIRTIDEGEKQYQLYPLALNKSNFQIVAQSAEVEVYSIALQAFQKSFVQKWKDGLLFSQEGIYINLLRRTEQKINSQKYIKEKYVAIVREREQINNQKLINKNNEKQKQDNKHKQKKVNIQKLINKEVSYKMKIEGLLREKLQLKKNEKDKKQVRKFVDGMHELFENVQQNETHRLQKKYQQLQAKKLLISSSSSTNFQIINPSQFDIQTSKSFRINFIRRQNFLGNKDTFIKNYLTEFDPAQYVNKMKKTFTAKIYETNKIKEQFLKIQSECKQCQCYADYSAKNSQIQSRRTWIKWKSFQNQQLEEPLELIYRQKKFLKDRTIEKYDHKDHLRMTKRNRFIPERKYSAPIL